MKRMIIVLILLIGIFTAAIADEVGFEDKLITLKSKDIVTGYDDGEDRLERGMTKAEFVASVVRWRQIEKHWDIKPSEGKWADSYIDIAYKNGIISNTQGLYGEYVDYGFLTSVLIKSLGYNHLIDTNTNGEYTNLASRMNIIEKNIDINKVLTRREVFEYLYKIICFGRYENYFSMTRTSDDKYYPLVLIRIDRKECLYDKTSMEIMPALLDRITNINDYDVEMEMLDKLKALDDIELSDGPKMTYGDFTSILVRCLFDQELLDHCYQSEDDGDWTKVYINIAADMSLMQRDTDSNKIITGREACVIITKKLGTKVFLENGNLKDEYINAMKNSSETLVEDKELTKEEGYRFIYNALFNKELGQVAGVALSYVNTEHYLHRNDDIIHELGTVDKVMDRYILIDGVRYKLMKEVNIDDYNNEKVEFFYIEEENERIILYMSITK